MNRLTRHLPTPLLKTGWAFACLSLASLPVLAQSPAGTLMFVHGEATILRDDETLEATRGDEVFPGDIIETAQASSVQLRYSDGGTTAIRPDSSFSLDAYRHEEDDPGGGEKRTELLRGGLRMISGAIGEANPDAVRHDTPVATMGIRGTSFRLRHIPEDAGGNGADPGSYLNVEEGQVAFTTQAGTRVANPGDVFFAGGPDQAPGLRPDALPIFDNGLPQDEESSEDGDESNGDGGFMGQADLEDDSGPDTIRNEAIAGISRPARIRSADDPAPPTGDPEGDPEDQSPPPSHETDLLWADVFQNNNNNLTLAGDQGSALSRLQNTAYDPEALERTRLQDGDILWGYWAAGTDFPDTPSVDDLAASLVFITASPSLDTSTVLPDNLGIPDAGFRFDLVGSTPLVDLAGSDTIDILSGHIDVGVSGSVGVEFQLQDDYGSLSGTGEDFSLADISLDNVDADFFEGGRFDGRYVGDDAEAIMGLIEAWNEDARYGGAAALER
jgi:hypothetical protein